MNKQEFIDKYRVNQAVKHPDTFWTKIKRNFTFCNLFAVIFCILGVIDELIYIVLLVSYKSVSSTYQDLSKALKSMGITGSLENTFFAHYNGPNKAEMQYAHVFNYVGPWILVVGIILLAIAVIFKWCLPELISWLKERKHANE